jgi:hypothetical protein
MRLTIVLLSLLSLLLVYVLWIVTANSSARENALFKLATDLCIELEQSEFSKRKACFNRVVEASVNQK